MRGGASGITARNLQLAVLPMLAFITLALCSGCKTVNESTPVKGGSYALADPFTDFSETLAQGDNAQTASRLKREVRGYDTSGKLVALTRTSVELGTSRDPLITLKPVPAYGQYAVAVIGALALIGGAVLAFKSWPKIGGTICVGGFVVLVIGLTAGSYGWAWALLATALCASAAFALYSGYKSGQAEAA